ncbi:hypothetical protein MKY34_11760 [Sporosarcina sp. FSL K6-1522]|uniref:hypothetical protein n=1 Tax=Sporosarcina sp. FSL K6-1522 TaxID=2921554 RepID=UPI00315A792C
MTHYVKIIVGSLLFATIIVSINRVIGYFITGEFGNLLNVRSIILFTIVFTISAVTTMAEGSRAG